VYFSVRKVIEATWLNDRDQFLAPDEGWRTDTEFQHDCLAYTLFNNLIESRYGINYWIPFTEQDVDANDTFSSHFMTDFIAGRHQQVNLQSTIQFDNESTQSSIIQFSPAAQQVMNAGRELWRYYHAQANANPNASLYEIREHFQGRKGNGKMNNRSSDDKYNELIATLRKNIELLARKIEPKVYDYGFLRR
jgi:hypothetical protein